MFIPIVYCALVHANNDDLGPKDAMAAGQCARRRNARSNAFPSSYSGIYDTATYTIITASIKFF